MADLAGVRRQQSGQPRLQGRGHQGNRRFDRTRALHRGRADPRAEAGQGQRLRLHGSHPADRHAGDLDRDLAGNRRRRLHPAQRPRRRHPLQARKESGQQGTRRRPVGNHSLQYPCAGDRSGAEGKRGHQHPRRPHRHARTEARAGRDAGARAPERHAGARVAQHHRRQRDGEGRSEDQVQKRSESVNVVRYGVANQTTAQK